MTPSRPWYERAFDAPYLEVYGHRDAAEAEEATRALLAPLGLGGRRVLDVGCGGGRYSRAVAAHGARVVGLDLSWPLLQQAAATCRRGTVDFVRGTMLALPFHGATYSLAISMFTSFGYFASAAHDRRVVEEVRRVLVPGGYFVLDVLNAPQVRRTLVPRSRRRAGRYEVIERRRIDPRRRLVIKHVALCRGGEVRRYWERVRLWDRAELESLLGSCGFAVERLWGDYRGGSWHAERSPRLIVCARRRDAPA